MKKNYQQSEIRAWEDFKGFGSKLVPCSGALPGEKLDVTLDNRFRISNKHTIRKSISIKLDDVKKDESQAKFMGAKLIRRIEFEDPNTGKLSKFILVDQDLFTEILGYLPTYYD